MSRTDSVQDSSMEEILASIRRIISEDAGPAPFGGEPSRKPVAPAARPIDFGAPPPLPSFAREMARPPVAAAVKPALPMMASRPFEVAPPPPAPVASAVASDDDDILDLDASYTAATHRATPFAASVPAPQLAIVREASPAVMPVPVPAPPTVEQPIDELLQPDPDPEVVVAAEPVAEAQAEPVVETVVTTHVQQIDISEPVRWQPMPEATATLLESMPAAAVSPQATERAEVEPITPIQVDVAPIAVESGNETLSTPKIETAAGVFSPAAAMAEAVVQAISEPAQVSAIAAPPLAAAQSAPRTMEDMVAEMLRPMLREWLDSNMPRIIEKTLAKPRE